MSTRLEQQSDSLTYYQGWYGKCPETGDNICEPFSLLNGDVGNPATLEKKYPEILKVLETSSNTEGQTSYIGTIPDGCLFDHANYQRTFVWSLLFNCIKKR